MMAAASRLLLFGGFLSMLALHIIEYLNSSPRFLIAHIAVKGNTRVPAREVTARSGIVEDDNIFSVRLADTAAAVKEIPWVREARIARKFPNEILIEITERRPVALVLSPTNGRSRGGAGDNPNHERDELGGKPRNIRD
jgi:cell division protein FtsQ